MIHSESAGEGSVMNAMQVAILATRVVGLFLLFECIGTIGLAWRIIRSDEQWSPLIAAVILYGLLAGVFFFGGKRIAGLFLGSDSDPETGEAGLRDVQAIAFSVVGLWFLSHALMQAGPTGPACAPARQ